MRYFTRCKKYTLMYVYLLSTLNMHTILQYPLCAILFIKRKEMLLQNKGR